jgi:tRNA-2-methylthio-N6-dimethylallyladenosine synthase
VENQVPEDVKAERLQKVQHLATQHGLERSERYLGKVTEVLVEAINPRNSMQVCGRTHQNGQVFFDADFYGVFEHLLERGERHTGAHIIRMVQLII